MSDFHNWVLWAIFWAFALVVWWSRHQAHVHSINRKPHADGAAD